MKKFVLKLATILALLLCAELAVAQDKVFFQTLPVPNGVEPSNDPSIPKIAWNRWTTKNFSIHSIDFNQGEYLFHNIENMKAWCLTRWGLPDIQFASECRIFCAPTKELMKKLFNLESSYGEVKIQNGQIIINYLWLVLDSQPAEIIPPALTIICMKEFNQKYQLNLGWWVYRGMPIMNATLPQIRTNLVFLGSMQNFSVKSFFSMTEDQWKKLTPEQRHMFDAEAALMCLFLRKEYGQNNFQFFLKYGFEENVRKYLGFNDLSQFETVFKRFAINLANDIRQNRCPDTYLQVEAVKK